MPQIVFRGLGVNFQKVILKYIFFFVNGNITQVLKTVEMVIFTKINFILKLKKRCKSVLVLLERISDFKYEKKGLQLFGDSVPQTPCSCITKSSVKKIPG